ncbi:MAG: metallophosphoesterase [Accumulibacter sp.]
MLQSLLKLVQNLAEQRIDSRRMVRMGSRRWHRYIKGRAQPAYALPGSLALLALAPLLAGAAPPLAAPAVLLAAGDIADCGSGSAATAKLIDTHPGMVLAVGDLAYPLGSREDFKKCFAPTWGRFLSRMKSVPGNHEYMTAGAQPYFATMGSIAGPPRKGYYSLDYHGWHLIALNSHIPMNSNSPQAEWLKEDVAQTSARCRLAFLHLPRFSSGEGGDNDSTDALWRTLAAGGVSIVIAGHDHLYERFALLNADGSADESDGMRAFTVGTGGATLDRKPLWARRHSEKLVTGRWGVLKLELGNDSYRWSFLDTNGQVPDSGEGSCRARGSGKK